MEKELEAPLRQAIRALSKHGYRYALIGRVALSQWGVVRATYDVDIKILVPDLDFDGVRASLRTAFPVRARAHVPENPYIVAVEIDGVIVDFLLTLPGYEEQIIERDSVRSRRLVGVGLFGRRLDRPESCSGAQ